MFWLGSNSDITQLDTMGSHRCRKWPSPAFYRGMFQVRQDKEETGKSRTGNEEGRGGKAEEASKNVI